ncbi:MAG: phosphate acetyltransferase [Candidatus Cloacimonadota bacterium]|nr:MAG: phosphate acetyltransferase [Candidatus Cloacimonadota bacterium]PIE77740.1 MAG: phosphate acetyltransferase [Candidatus Delongbacteria bacterium]
MVNIMEQIIEKAQKRERHIVLPEGFDERMVVAASKLSTEKICKVTLLGEKSVIEDIAIKKGVCLRGIEIINPLESEWIDEFANKFFELRKHKGITLEQSMEIVKNYLFFGNLMVKTGRADGCVAGAHSTTGDVMRSCLQVIGVAKGTKLVSSTFMMIMPSGDVKFFSDCALVPDPDAEGLASIAISTADTYRKIMGEEPTVAMLSFSTKGSGGNNPMVNKVVEATKIVKENAPELKVDGELQLDAAIVESVGKKKAPESDVAGKANVLIFPDLNAGNIGYKLTQRLGEAEAIGPFVQGLALPSFDLSRGCSSEDIVNTSAVCSLMAN